MHVEVDGEVVTDLDRPVLMVAIGNGANVGGGTELTPEADPEDGKIDVFSPESPLGAAILGAKVGDRVSYTAPTGKELKVEVVEAKPYNG
jgi:diacylglycerol kinase family enzyme